MSVQQWPMMVNGRVAADRAEALVLLSHTTECAIHEADIVEQAPPKQPVLRARHPEHERICDCAGVKPSAADLKAIGIHPLDHDANGRKGGSKPKSA